LRRGRSVAINVHVEVGLTQRGARRDVDAPLFPLDSTVIQGDACGLAAVDFEAPRVPRREVAVALPTGPSDIGEEVDYAESELTDLRRIEMG
jgi:hypothetical protein